MASHSKARAINFAMLVSVGFLQASCSGTDPIVGRWGAGTKDYAEFRADGTVPGHVSSLNWKRLNDTEIVLTSDDPKAPKNESIHVKIDVSNDHEVLYLSPLDSDSKPVKDAPFTLKAFHGTSSEWEAMNRKFTPEASKERISIKVAAKSIASEISVYAGDNDQSLPRQASDLTQYSFGQPIDSRLELTMPGASVKDMKDPETTVVGILKGTYGKAEIYADFQTKWIDY